MTEGVGVCVFFKDTGSFTLFVWKNRGKVYVGLTKYRLSEAYSAL